MIDDRFGLAPWIKLLGQCLAAVTLFSFSGYSFAGLVGTEMPVAIDLALTVLWCVALINAFNLIDGLDGLCGGLAVISSLGMAATFLFRGFPGECIVLLALVGATLGFLRYNFHPARIFLGDTGSMFLGFTLAAVCLESGGKSTLIVSLGMPFIAAGIPIMDTVLAIWRRSVRRVIARRAGAETVGKVMDADKDHLHHRFLQTGMDQRRVALLLYFGNLCLVVLGILWILFSQATVGVFLLMVLAGFYVLVRHVVHVELWDTGQMLASGVRQPEKQLLGHIIFPFFDLFWLTVSCFSAAYLVHVVTSTGPFSLYRLSPQYPLWVLPVMLALVLTNSYLRVWALAVFRDFLVLGIAVTVGVLIPFSLQTIFTLYFGAGDLIFPILFWTFAISGIAVVRVLRHVMREWLATAVQDRKTANRYETKNLLIYGAGDRGLLFVRDRMMVHPEELAKNRIVGFIDDNPLLRKRYIHGFRVAGTGSELEALVTENDIDQIVVTCHLTPASSENLIAVARRYNLTVREWNRKVRLVIDQGVLPDSRSEKLGDPGLGRVSP